MAIRLIKQEGKDKVLRKVSKPVENITKRVLNQLDDMVDTMYHANGAGLAAVQVGLLKRMFVIDVGEGLHEFINPVIMSTSGSEKADEGCLSVPGIRAEVERPYKVVVKALNREGEEFTLEAEGFLARAVCHEYDHLEAKLFIDRADKDTIVREENY